MPLNQPKTYGFVPSPVGEVKLTSRSSRRARLWAGGTYFRSIEYGEAANLLRLCVVEDLGVSEGLFVVQHTMLKPTEQISVENMATPTVDLFDLNLQWNEEVRVVKESGALVARKYGIRWQIAAGPSDPPVELGTVTSGRLFRSSGIAFKIGTSAADWPTNGVLHLRPRTHRYTLVSRVDTDPDTMQISTGWDIAVLRGALNGVDAWIRMPARGGGSTFVGGDNGPAEPMGEDMMDTLTDSVFLTAFSPTNMSGGDGLPLSPAGLNTGPARVLVHLNYSELENGTMGELNQVFEWEGESSTIGGWTRYS